MAKGISFEEALRPPEPAKPTGGFSFEEVMRPAQAVAPAASAPAARKQEAPPAPVETAAGVLPTEATDLRDVFGRDLLSRPGREATFLGELGRGAKGAVEYGFPIMGRQLALQGSASAMAERQKQMALMDQIDQGQFNTLADLKNNAQYQAMRKEGADVGTLNAYFANRGQPEVSAKLRGGVEKKLTEIAGDTAGHIKTLNQYARENKAKYGPRVEKFSDINWTDPAVVADFKDWLGYNMGSGAVQAVPIMLAAAVTKRPGLLTVGGGVGVSEAVSNRLKFIQDQVKSLPPEQQGDAIAKYIAETGDANLVTGLIAGSFDLLLGPAARLAKGALPKELGRMATVKQAVKELPKDVRGEAVTGALQQATQIAAAKKLQEEGRAVTWQNIKDVIDSAAAEAAGAPAGTAINVGMAALQAPSDPASQLARAIEEDAQRAGATPEALRMRSALEAAQAPPQARGFTFEEVTAPAAAAVPPAAPAGAPRTVESFVADITAGKQLDTPEDIQFYQNNAAAIESALATLGAPAAPAGVSLYERLGVPMGPARADAVNEEISIDDAVLLKKMIVKTVEDGLASGKTRQQIAAQLEALTRGGITPKDFNRIHDYMTERGVKEEAAVAPEMETIPGMPTGEELETLAETPAAAAVTPVTKAAVAPAEPPAEPAVTAAAPAVAAPVAPAAAPAAPEKPRTTMQDAIQGMTDAELQDARSNVMFSLPAVEAEIAKRQEQQAKTQEAQKLILQNRDRGGQASREQMESIARAPDYDRAGFSNTPDGAPIVAFGNIPANQLGRTGKVTTAGGKKIPIQYAVVEADEILTSNDINGSPDKRYGDPSVPGLRAIAGNGRVTGIREGFRRGTADAYRQAMTADDLHQVNPDVIAGMRNPVLVRLMPQESLSPTIGDELNQGSMLELSAVEQAKTDLNRVDFDTLSFGSDGEITPQSVNQFINSMPAAERGKLVDKGAPTRQAYQRLENAIFARAYQDDALISLFAQSQDPEARLLVSALMQVAPAMSRLEGAGNLDIREIVTDAAKMIISGKRRGLKLSEIASQADMTTNPDSLLVVQLFAANPRSNKAAVEALNNLANIAYQEYVKPEEGLFGAQPKIGRAELLTKIGGKYEPTAVAGAERAGAAPGDVQGKAKPSAAGVPVADQGLTLVGETEAEIKAKRDAAEEREKRERKERVEAERKAKADEERGEFVLTGSDRAADEAAARGQADIFGVAAAPTKKKPATFGPSDEIAPRVDSVESFLRGSKGFTPVVIAEDAPLYTETNAEGLERILAADRQFEEGGFYVSDNPDLAIGQGRNKGITVEFRPNSLSGAENKKPMTGLAGREYVTDVRAPRAVSKITVKDEGDLKLAWATKTLLREEFVMQRQPDGSVVFTRKPEFGGIEPGATGSVNKYVSKLDDQKKVESYETTDDVLVKTETSEWQGTISRKEFDDLVAAASASPQQRGNKYAINVVDTKDASAILTFTARGLTPTQQRVEVVMQLQRSQVVEPGAAEPGAAVDENDPGFLGASDKEVKDVAKAFDQYAETQEDEQNTRVFDAPEKSEIVRIEEKARREGVLTIAEAKKRIAEWKKNALAQGETRDNSDKVVLSLFDATGEWSKPWEEAGYQVFRFDIQTDPEFGDVNKFSAAFFNDLYGAFDGQDIYAVLAACPCTDFAASGARHFAAKDESGQTVESVQLVKQTLATIEYFKPSVWAIENPVGRIEKLTGLPPWRLSFNPNHFGDPYTKKTLLWGRFNADLPVAPVAPTEGSKMHRMYGGKSQETKNARSVTPEGFAYAFFQANNAVDNPVVAIANKYDMLDRKVVEQAVKAGLTEKEIADAVEESYYMELDYAAANAALKAATDQKKPMGAAVMGQRMVNAADRFRKAAMSQHKLTQEQADAAMGALTRAKVLILDSVTGQFELKDGRFWNRDVLLRAAGEGDKPFTMLENIEPIATAGRAGWTEKRVDSLISTYGYADGKTFGIAAFVDPQFFLEATTANVAGIREIRTEAGKLDLQKLASETQTPYLKINIGADGAWEIVGHEGRHRAAALQKEGIRQMPVVLNILKGGFKYPAKFDVAPSQELLGQTFGKARGEDVEVSNLIPINQQNKELLNKEFGRGQILYNIEPTAKKLPPGRSPELAAAAQRLQRGEITAKEFDELVNKYKPIPVYFAPLRPATSAEVYNALDSAKREKIDPKIAAGAPVGLRLDIPAFNRHGVFVVSIHEKRTASAPGKVIGYSSAASIKNVTFGVGNQKEALKIAAGAAKDAIQTMEGQYVPLTTEQAYQIADDAILSGDWVQVGFDPTRHAYFFDRSTTQPIVAADEVVQIGNMILAKGVKYAPKDSFLYNMDEQAASTFDESDSDAWTAKPSTVDDKEVGRDSAKKIRDDQIREYAALRRKLARIPDKVARGEASLDMQSTLARMIQRSRTLQVGIRESKPRLDSPEQFLARALKEYDAGNITRDVLQVIQTAYAKEPSLLEGLLLSVRKTEGGAAGAFSPLERIVFLYKGTSGVNDPTTIRHELTHSLEQMMLPSQSMVVVQAWGKAFARAIKQYPDDLHQRYFNAVLDFLDNPTRQTFEAAKASLPSYDMYQFINPSEFWAVNAERLMAAQLGGSWDKFKRAVRKLWEGIKKILGFDNRYDIHKVFNQVMGGSRDRMNYSALVNMVQGTGGSFVTLDNIEDDKRLMEKYNRPNTPMMDSSPIRTFLTRQFKNGKEFFTDAVNNPREAMVGSANSVMDGLIYLRNKNVWYGSGLEARDFAQYNGELRTSEGMATASVALDNAIRSGNIGVEVIFRGGIKFDPRSGTFVGVETEKGMRGVYEAEAELKKQLGDQLGTDVIQGYLEAKRSISIMNELYEREAALEMATENLRFLRESGADPEDIAQAKAFMEETAQDVDSIKKAASSVNMSEEEMYEFAGLEDKHPELRKLMDNWTAINQNLLRFWRQVGLLSQGRYETLSAIKDYVPWYRIMNDEMDLHDSSQSAVQSTTRSMTNIGREKLFKRGRPVSVVDFRAKEGQQEFKIQPSSVVQVEVNGKKVSKDLVTATPDGNVRIDLPLVENDLVVFKTNREIQNIIDNMTRNVMRMTMNGIRQYAANRIVLEYASRNEKNKIMVFPSVDKEKGRFNWMVNGKKVVVEIQDPLVAASIYGMENLNLQMWRPLAAVANLTRRAITLSGTFQIKQVFKDAPTAALVTGVKNPIALIGGAYKGFLTSLTNTDPVVDILKAAGIGGYMSPARTPEAEIKRRLGIMNRNVFSTVIKGLDHIGDASDMAQRVATYKRVLAETGDEMQALYQAANVINFLHHGSAGYAQAAVKTVPFLGAYANATDVLVRALVGGGLKGVSRKKALMRLGITTSILVSLTILYAMLAGADPEYDELDDQTKLKNIIIPGTKIMLPMNTSAAYFFKAVPELIYNAVTRQGTENEMDRRRIRNALGDAARDMLLGPEPIPAGFKPLFEVAINHDFFSGRPVIPEGLKDVEAAEQYTAATSELGKKISAALAIPGTDGKRVLSPIEADHIVRGVFGTSGAMAQWFTNSIGAMAESRPAPTAKETPITGSFLREEVPRGREDLFYDFKEGVSKKYETWKKMMDREDYDAADAYLEKHGDVVGMYEYINEAETDLKEINAEIRRLGETRSKDMTPKERRQEIEDFKRLKQEVLEPVKELRREVFK